MIKLKIFKISADIFKHVFKEEEGGQEFVFYNTKDTKLGVDSNIFSISSAWHTRYFKPNEIQVYDIEEVLQTETSNMDDLVTTLESLKYPPLLESQSNGGGGVAGGSAEAKQDIGNTSLANIDINTDDIPNVIASEGGAQPSKGVVVMGHTGAGVVKHILVDSNGVQSVNVNNSALPTGGATEAKQDIANTSLDNIDDKTPALIDGATPISDNGKSITVDSFNGKLREAFQTFPNTNWTVPKQGAGDIIAIEGNAGGASYLSISLDPLTPNTETWVESVGRFKMPSELAFGAHMSQRTVGQEVSMEFVSDEPIIPLFSDIAISSIQQATTTLTVTTSQEHGLKVGNRIGIRGVVDSRLNYPSLVIATTPTLTSFTVTAGSAGTIPSLTAGPFTNGFIYARSAMGGSPNGTSMLFENGSSTNASFYAKSESGDSMPIGGVIGGNHSATISTSSSIQPINAALNYAFRPTTEYRLSMLIDRLQWSDVTVDSVGQSSSRANLSQVVPNPEVDYKVRFRATNNKSLTVPVAQIVSAVKTGTTTATITTDVPHGLTTTDLVTIYGIRDQAAASFPNLTSATAVASVINATQFTVVIGTAATVTSYGGYVARVNGGNLMSSLGAISQTVQSVVRTSNVLTVVGSASWSGLSIGDLINLVGVRNTINGASIGIDGAYRVRDIQTTNLFLEPVGNTPTGTNISLTNCGGGVIKRTDFRLSFIRLLDYERLRIEALPRPGGDSANALPVAVNGGYLNAIGTLGNPSAPTNQFINSIAGTNIASISTASTGVSSIYATNTGSTAAYIKLYNKATLPVLATDIPEMIIVVPAAVSGAPGVYTLPIGFSGLRFNLGLGIAITGGSVDTDTTAVTAGQVKVKMSRNA
jgi:hypothetical protein